MRRPESGFTMIELMVVMLLLGSAVVYGLVNIGALIPSARLEEGARDVGGILSRLRGMAVFQGQPFFLEYDLEDHKYRVFRPTSLEERNEGLAEYIDGEWRKLPPHVRFRDVQFSADQVETNGRHKAEFSPTGEVTGHLVHLVSDDIPDQDERNIYTLELNPITGLVSYTRGDKRYQQIRDEYAFR